MAKELNKQTQEKLQELQMLQQRMQLFAAQKQQFQLQLMETENALAELEGAKSPVFKMVGELLVEKNPEELKKELIGKKSDLDIRIKSFEKQESKTKERALELQKEVTAELK